ncbi:MAG: tRNA (adenosine(37)-N6)-threonylcarbamoyltransferase complex dimerization subunit type 1 TsaB [Rubrivivax sp.]|nr:tRNA (adenosine(37)-N6)-threonylcarbamoyltransferase complex dimerization subunit type 1 TsaB [Rubrivivax sp.]
MAVPTQPMLPVLALDTSTESIAAGLQTGRAAFHAQVPGGALASRALMPCLQALLVQAGLRWADIQAIAFGRGPGAFTGLRTACAVAQGLGFGLARPLLPLDSLLIVAEDAHAQAGAPAQWDVSVAMDARMDEVYAARYRWQQGQWCVLEAPALLSLAQLADRWAAAAPGALAGSALAAFAGRLPLPAGVPCFTQEQHRAAALLRLAVRAVEAGAGVDAAEALQLYLRDKVALTTDERLAARQPQRTSA